MSSLLAFIFVGAQARKPEGETAAALAEIPEVLEAHRVAGRDCYLLKVEVANVEALGSLVSDRLGAIDSLRDATTTVVLKTVKG